MRDKDIVEVETPDVKYTNPNSLQGKTDQEKSLTQQEFVREVVDWFCKQDFSKQQEIYDEIKGQTHVN